MATAAQVKVDYGNTAVEYSSLTDLPQGKLESELIKAAIGDVTGLLVLDLGGGSALHARAAIDAGAKRVDLLDLTPEMMQIGKDIEQSLGREDRIHFYEADVSKPLGHLPLEQYDVVMANWVFDHAGDIETLEGMWRNIAAYLKPGGKFLGVRCADIHSPSIHETTKYGLSLKDLKPIPGGMEYMVVIHTSTPWEFKGTSMEISNSGSTEFHEKYGLTDIEVLSCENTETVQQDPEFWKTFSDRPFFVVVKATKRTT